VQQGYTETVRPEPTAKRPGLEALIRSTASFEFRQATTWPPRTFVLSKIHYSSLNTCALLLFHREAPEDAFRYKLIRVGAQTRRLRARAHVINGLLLYRKEDDLDGALAETTIAAETDPDYGPGRYYHALLLAAHGRFDGALGELAAAVSLDQRFAQKAREAAEFEDLSRDQRFLAIVQTTPP